MNLIIEPARKDWIKILERPSASVQELAPLIKEVFDKVKDKGDAALFEYTNKWDGVKLTSLKVTEDEIKEALDIVPAELRNAIQHAKNNIEKFHAAQKIKKKIISTTPGVACWQESRPIEKVGIYIPGGTAPLFSTVLMLGIPAKIAGCKKIILCTPPKKDGSIDPAILYAAQLVGVTEIYKVGGIQAIAALTFGSESITQVSKIFGPGNQYVTVAKQAAFNHGVAIDMPAGPSELLVVADDTSNASFVASDLLSQAEHGADSQVICITNKEEMAIEIQREINLQLQELSRKDIAQRSLAHSRIIVISSKEDTIKLVNEYAPEHLILCTKKNNYYLEHLQNAGSVFLGNYSPESAGDYASGTNHVLPTNGFSKAFSGVSLDSFIKKITVQEVSEEGIKNIGRTVEIMADAEGLQAHKNAVTLRLNSLN